MNVVLGPERKSCMWIYEACYTEKQLRSLWPKCCCMGSSRHNGVDISGRSMKSDRLAKVEFRILSFQIICSDWFANYIHVIVSLCHCLPWFNDNCQKSISIIAKSWIVYPYWGMSINKLTNKDLYTDCTHSHSHYGMDDHKHQKPYTILVWRRWREGDIQCFDPYARLPTIRSRYFAYMYGFLWYETHTHIYICII